MVRVYVGGVPPDVSPSELAQRFASFGEVQGCELLPPKAGALPSVSFQTFLASGGRQQHHGRTAAGASASAGQPASSAHRGVAYLELQPEDAAALQKCLRVYNNSKWRGSTLRVELAQPSYLQKLQEEWRADEEAAVNGASEPPGASPTPRAVLHTLRNTFWRALKSAAKHMRRSSALESCVCPDHWRQTGRRCCLPDFKFARSNFLDSR